MRPTLILVLLAILAPALGAEEIHELQEAWRLGGFSEDPDEFFGVIVDIAEDASGRVHLLDRQLARISVYGRDGAFLFAYGSEGEGPGEFRDPRQLVRTPQPGMGVLQAKPFRLLHFDVEGRFAGELLLATATEPGAYPTRIEAAVHGYVLEITGTEFEKRRMLNLRRVLRVDAAGVASCEVIQQATGVDFAKLRVREGDPAELLWTVMQSGTLFLGRDHGYTLEIYDAACDRTGTLARPYTPRRRTAADREALLAGPYRNWVAKGAAVELQEFHRAIRWLGIGPRGLLWVLSDRGARIDGTLGRFDLFEESGRFVKSVSMVGEGELGSDRFVLSGERLYVLRHAEDALRSYERSWNPGRASEDEADPEPMLVIAYDLPAVLLN